jgi:hypothetical protein
MFCPKCSQEIRGQRSEVRGQGATDLGVEQVQFCSHCGLSLSKLSEFIAGSRTQTAKHKKQDADSKRRKGLKQGALLMLLSVILIPAYFLLAALFPPNDRLVESAVSDTPFEKISQAVLLTLFLLGLVRASYAWFFQKETRPELESQASPAALPAATATPVSGFGAWRTPSGELVDHIDSRQ